MISPERCYLDTNILILLSEGGGDQEIASLLAELVETAPARSGTPFAVSALVLAELLVKPLAVGDRQLAQFYEHLIEPSDWLDVLPVDRAVLIQSAGLRTSHRLKLPDAIHLATALSAGCSHFLTADTGFADTAGITVLRPEPRVLKDLLEAWHK